MFGINAALRMSPRVAEPPRADASAKPFRIGAMFTTNAPAARRELWRCGVGPPCLVWLESRDSHVLLDGVNTFSVRPAGRPKFYFHDGISTSAPKNRHPDAKPE